MRRRGLSWFVAFAALLSALVSGVMAASAARAAAPTVTSFNPATGPVGTTVTLNGTGFTTPTTASFNGVSSAATVVSGTKATVRVPAGATSGLLKVTTGGGTVTGKAFTVSLGISTSVAGGPPTTQLTLNGSGFAGNEAVDLYEGLTDVALVASGPGGTFSYSGITVPVSAPPGTLWISAIGRRSGLATQVAFTVSSNWAQRGYGIAHAGRNRYENTVSRANVEELASLWTVHTGALIDSSPAVVAGVVYVGSEDHSIYALDAVTGAVKWKHLSGGLVFSSPAVYSGVVYVGSEDDQLYALNAATGGLRWSATVAARLTPRLQ